MMQLYTICHASLKIMAGVSLNISNGYIIHLCHCVFGLMDISCSLPKEINYRH
jgi:hypothetical protein